MKLHIKNMVCPRCKMAVEATLEKLGIKYRLVELGQVELLENIDSTLKEELLVNLQSLGFELLDDKKSKTVEQIRNLIVNLVHSRNDGRKINLSQYLSSQIGQDYSALSNLFSETEATTIEQYFILQKIEKVKELLTYDELSLSEIADLLNYSSVGYLSNQFKKVTGMSPSDFKKIRQRNGIDSL